MAEAQLLVSQDEFTCSVCLDILSDPVSLHCGHSFCLKCLTDCWDQSQVCSFPQCRHTFTTRPELNRNTLLNEVVKKLKKMGLTPSPPQTQNYAGPEDVECDFCIGKKFRAVKSCLTCLASFCQTHLQPHNEIVTWKGHKLTAPDGNLKENLCVKHQKSLEIFCKTDETCICMMCVVTRHKNHEMVELETEREEKEKQLGVTLSDIRRRLEEREKKLKETRRVMEQMKVSLERELEKNEKSFTDLIHYIEEAQKKLVERIREQEKREIEKAEGVMERLEKEIEELKKKDAELKELSGTKDHVHFLQTFSSRCVLPSDGDSLSFTVTADFSFEDQRKELSGLKKSLEKISQWDIKTWTPSAFSQTIPKALKRYHHEDLLKITEHFRPCLAYLIKAKMTNILESLVSKEILTNDEENLKHFTDLIQCMKEAHETPVERIREQEKEEIEKAEGVMEQLEKEIKELKKRDAELKELSDTKNSVHFMQIFSSRCVLPANGDSLSFTVNADFSSEELRNDPSCQEKSLEKISQWDIKTSTSSDLHETHRQAVSESTRTLEAQASPGDPHTTAVGFETRYTELVAVEQDPRNHKETEHELMKTGRFHEELMKKGAAEKCEQIWIEQLFRKSSLSVNAANIIVVSGMAGIGKTTMVQKIMYDWARGTQYQRFAFVFLFKFRELNLLDNENETQMSLTKLIERHYKYLSNDPLKDVLKNPETLLFIFDGLDEYKHKLDFTQSQLCSNPDVEVPVHILVTSLVSRTLLKGCSVLITSRPTALEAMDMERVDRFVEILGFIPEQRLMYCKKFFGDTALAAQAFQYVKENTILYTMCFSPSYCWMICSVLKRHFMTPEKNKSEALQVGQWLCETQNKELIRETIGEDLKMDFRSTTLSAVDCAVLANVISCCGELKELELSGTPLTTECIKILEPGLSCCSVVRLVSCGLTARCCSALSSALSAPNSHLTELMLDYNNMEDSGVEQLCEGLRSPNCKLEKLQLDSCGLTSACCSALSSVLSSPNSRLTELWLNNNNLGDSGACQLSKGLRSDNCKLTDLWLQNNRIRRSEERNLRSLQEELSRSGRQLTIITGKD
ncbi:NAL12 protein, partial [Polypterus senegalus]